jgi:hypothetical protein
MRRVIGSLGWECREISAQAVCGQPYGLPRLQQQQRQREEFKGLFSDMAPDLPLSVGKAKKSVIRPSGFPVESAGNKAPPGLCILVSP